ncbi:MAG: DUF1599 domain-containing protein [Bacteroidetes bacterium]|nr:DUF1599 domain-containing protein [Bacteroidota bacterium]MBL6963849.1 DUF1599 domain-containing protein [Bacteroidota bacterium]
MTDKTNIQYNKQSQKARTLFINKNKDYGTSWRILRLPSLIDQIYIKTDRIRHMEEGKIPKIKEDASSEYIGIINYCIITLIQIELAESSQENLAFEEVLQKYDYYLKEAQSLMNKKNHDYGEAWRNMYISSYTDLILTKILRIKQIIENEGKTNVSEGIEGNLYDMINYSFFALIKLTEGNEKQ